MPTQTWFITGSSRGLGRALTIAALEAGDSVAATARTPEQLADLVTQYGDRILALQLDVTDPDAATRALHAAVNRFGTVDVVVNNAGYANVAPIETAPEEDFRSQFDTNFWGVYNVSKAALPILKQQSSGTFVQLSSMGGRVGGTPGLASYQAAKFAVDGFSRVLASETAAFGIRVIVVEPSGFATDWSGTSMEVQNVPADYTASVGQFTQVIGTDRMTAGDPRRAGEILVRVVKTDSPPTHLLLGTDAAEGAIQYSMDQVAEATTWKTVSVSADFVSAYPVDLPHVAE